MEWESRSEGEDVWILPRYWRMKVPGFRSLVAKRPDSPFALG